MARHSPYPMISIEEALALIVGHCPVQPRLALPFDQAHGAVLAAPIVADDPMPPFRAATVDGFAVRAADGATERTLVGAQFAGYDAALRVGAGQAARITTGAPLPAGADAVMMVEWSEERDGRVGFSRSVAAGDFVRPIGSDIAQGEAILTAGQPLGPAEIGLLATIGRLEVDIFRPPRVGVMSTGDELVAPYERPAPGQIRDSNRYSLIAAIREAGGETLDLGIAPDSEEELRNFMVQGAAHCDLMVTSGGVSMGELDLVKPLLAELGTVHFGRVNTKPGKPLTFATFEGKPFFAMPGNPVSSLVCFELFVRPALRKMRGFPEDRWHRPRIVATLSHTAPHSADRTEFQRATLHFDAAQGRYIATTTGNQRSSRLLSMVGANGLIVLPHGHGDYKAGSTVEAMLL